MPLFCTSFVYFLGINTIMKKYFPIIDRQGGPPIPPVVAWLGAATTFAVGGVLQQTGVIDIVDILEQIRDVVGMLIQFRL